MRSIIVLTIVGICSALLLGVVNSYTEKPIQDALERQKTKALQEIFPFNIKDVITIEDEGVTYYEMRDEGKLKGVAVETYTEKGYSGKILVLLAVALDFTVYDYKVLTHKETPGLGDKISKDVFRAQFYNKSLKGVVWKVKKDCGFVDAITAATVSSRAITDAIERGLKLVSSKYSGGKK